MKTASLFAYFLFSAAHAHAVRVKVTSDLNVSRSAAVELRYLKAESMSADEAWQEVLSRFQIIPRFPKPTGFFFIGDDFQQNRIV